ncbi:MAG: ABC transporter substrate-binding protein [Micrococcales bacterium]|nr:ABC transporter substrate-binding protein [Micrococcales bacterium]
MRTTRIIDSKALVPLALLLLAVLVVAGCSSDSSSDASSSSDDSTSSGSCPDGDTSLSISASVDQWGDIAEQLAGDCGEVDTVITSSSVDPHDYEPTSSDIQKMTSAQVAVINGADYDPWAEKALEGSDVTVVDAGTVCGAETGANPHLWYDPDCVMKMGAAMSEAYEKADESTKSYFENLQKQWTEDMKSYTDAVAATKKVADGKTYGATESVFDYMASAVGMKNETPQGYQNASKNESDPAPGDIQAFKSALTNNDMDVLIFNTQTEGPVPSQLKETADSANVPVVDVTETVPDDASTFQEWQINQLDSLQQALQ